MNKRNMKQSSEPLNDQAYNTTDVKTGSLLNES